ncbi:hypothetical protein, partial [Micromonospora sp. NPDC049033]|uniref:hypothetical protein n=1 Tax=Micromonospora sp. NPDC049033 TaxID=3155149 RepID=UPI0033DDBB55
MAEVTPLPVVVGCVACGGTAGVEPVAMVPRASARASFGPPGGEALPQVVESGRGEDLDEFG